MAILVVLYLTSLLASITKYNEQQGPIIEYQENPKNIVNKYSMAMVV